MRCLYVSHGCSCITKGQRHSIFQLRTVLSDTDTGVGKSLGWNKELFRTSWLLQKVWMLASIEVLKPQVYFMSWLVTVACQRMKFAIERLERMWIIFNMHKKFLWGVCVFQKFVGQMEHTNQRTKRARKKYTLIPGRRYDRKCLHCIKLTQWHWAEFAFIFSLKIQCSKQVKAATVWS